MEILCVWPVLLYRRLRYGYAFRKVVLTQGKYAIVDPADFYNLSQYKWRVKKEENTAYAQRAEYKRRTTIMMHRQIMRAEKNFFVDHINHNGLDNRKANLRFATCRQNAWNSRKITNCGTSKYKGVRWNKKSKKWQATICNNNSRKIHLGFFNDEKAAARAYNKAAQKYRGEFALLNDV